MALRDFFSTPREAEAGTPALFAGLIAGYSIEVTPRTAAKIDDFKSLLPVGTRIYIAHIDATPIEDMVATAARLNDAGFEIMPHLPARSIASLSVLEEWLKRYRDDAGVAEALVLGGGNTAPVGALDNTMQLLNSGLFGKYGFRRLHVAGHPEGNRDIDAGGGTGIADEALCAKQAFAEASGVDMAIVTQFAFNAHSLIAWAERIAAAGITLPVHLGIAGPTKLQTLIRYAISCGVGPSLSVLQKRALDITKLMVPYEPTDLLEEVAAYGASHPHSLIRHIHVFPLGGLKASTEWMNSRVTSDLR